jgi:hypothetical protein
MRYIIKLDLELLPLVAETPATSLDELIGRKECSPPSAGPGRCSVRHCAVAYPIA